LWWTPACWKHPQHLTQVQLHRQDQFSVITMDAYQCSVVRAGRGRPDLKPRGPGFTTPLWHWLVVDKQSNMSNISWFIWQNNHVNYFIGSTKPPEQNRGDIITITISLISSLYFNS
jgi:hypothetical protein